jgi:hypothetical protein
MEREGLSTKEMIEEGKTEVKEKESSYTQRFRLSMGLSC